MSQTTNPFNQKASTYHTARPGYPGRMFDDIRVNCDIGNCGSILEIGAGTGIATKGIAQFGIPIIAIEPGDKLIKIARKNLNGMENVELIETRFEGYNPARKFDMVFSATAFHWLNKESKFRNVDSLLNDTGYLVLAWHSFQRDDSDVYHEIDTVYEKYMHDSSTQIDVNLFSLEKILTREREILDSGLFYTTFANKYIDKYCFTAKRYLQLLNSFSNIAIMKQREAFLKDIEEILIRYKTINLPVMTSLFICRKKSSFTKIILL